MTSSGENRGYGFVGRWSDYPQIKTKKGRCSFCRKSNRKVALMQDSLNQFCGTCMLLILHITRQTDGLRAVCGERPWDHRN